MFGLNKKNQNNEQPLNKGIGAGVGNTPTFTAEEAKIAGGAGFHDPQTHGALPIGGTDPEGINAESIAKSNVDTSNPMNSFMDNSFSNNAFDSFSQNSFSFDSNESNQKKNDINNDTQQNGFSSGFDNASQNGFGNSFGNDMFSNKAETFEVNNANPEPSSFNNWGNQFNDSDNQKKNTDIEKLNVDNVFGSNDNAVNFQTSPTTTLKKVDPFEPMMEQGRITDPEVKLNQEETLKKKGFPIKTVAIAATLATIGVIGASGYEIYKNKRNANPQTEIVENNHQTINEELPSIDQMMASEVAIASNPVENTEVNNVTNAAIEPPVLDNLNIKASEVQLPTSNVKEKVNLESKEVKPMTASTPQWAVQDESIKSMAASTSQLPIENNKSLNTPEVKQNESKQQLELANVETKPTVTNEKKVDSSTKPIEPVNIEPIHNENQIKNSNENKNTIEQNIQSSNEQIPAATSTITEPIHKENAIQNTETVVSKPKVSYEEKIRQIRIEAQQLNDKADALVRERNSLEKELFGKSKDEQIEILKREIAVLKDKQRSRLVKRKNSLENELLSESTQRSTPSKAKRLERKNKTASAVKNKSVAKKETFNQSKQTKSAIKSTKLPYHVYAATSGILLLKESKSRPALSYVAGDKLPNGETIININFFNKTLKTNKRTYNW